MSKKYYFILAPYDAKKEIDKKAEEYYGNVEYSNILNEPVFSTLISKAISKSYGECNTDMLLIGVSAIAMSMSNSVYVSKNWEQNDTCKFCHALAFSHGLEIVYES